ncbi:hypothetical protein ACI65C_009624 [Semiaphis heraclei]
MSENQPKEENTQNALSELLDDALKDFEEPNESNASGDALDLSEVNNFCASDNFLKESLEETMKSFMNSDQAELAAGLQELILGDEGSDLQTVIQESLKSLSEAKQNLPEGSDMTSMFANMGIQDDINLDEDMLPMLMQFMQPLLSKEVLYPSIKDLCDKYPKWLQDHEPTSDKEEFEKYKQMFSCIKEVRDHLENQQDTDDDVTKTRKFKELMELLKKMQECGQPPEELMRDVADGNPIPDNVGQCTVM